MKIKSLLALLVLFGSAGTASFAQQPTPQWRPVYHFTPDKNWTNDPNGLIYLNGEYHLYYQHNPLENKWGHMSWGHAASKDLVHWRHFPVAIPEVVGKDTTTWIYSGSAVLDKNNTSGFGQNGKPPIVAIFTADRPKQRNESQFIAYSNDGGFKFTLYKNNPVIDLNKSDFRDPNVFWHEPTKQWIMTVAMVNEHMVRIYGSKNLKQWTMLSDFGPAGYTKNGWECPSLLPVSVEGDPSKTKWVLFVSCGGDHGPLMQYWVGDFDGITYKNDNPAETELTVDYGDAFYAAIAWRDSPTKKNILLGWLQNGRRETAPWKGQMAIPHDLLLRQTSGGLRLIQLPSSVVTSALSIYTDGVPEVKNDLILYDQTVMLSSDGKYDNNTNWIDAEFAVEQGKAGFNVAANKDGSKKVVIGYDAAKQQLYVDCSASEQGAKSPENMVLRAPMRSAAGIVKLKVLIDKSSLEVFGNDGEKVISTMIYPDNEATGLSVFADGKAILKSLKVIEVKSTQAAN